MPTSPVPSPDAVRAYVGATESSRPDLIRFVTNLLSGDAHRAHDLVQDAILAAWRGLPELRDPAHLRAWLFRTSYRNAISALRRRGPRSRPIRPLHDLDAEIVAERAPPPPVAWNVRGEAVDSDDLVPALRRLLPSLPPTYEAVLRLHYLDGLDVVTSADVLGLPTPTVKMRLHRARRLLRQRLESETLRRRRGDPPGTFARHVRSPRTSRSGTTPDGRATRRGPGVAP